MPTLNVSIVFHTFCSHVRVQFESIGLSTLIVSASPRRVRRDSRVRGVPFAAPRAGFTRRRARTPRAMSTIVIDDKYALSDSDSVDADAPRCANCGVASDRLKKCAKCRRAHFCNAACQRAAWDAHARECVADANAKPAYKPPEPPRMPTKAEKEEAKESETRRIRETTLP